EDGNDAVGVGLDPAQRLAAGITGVRQRLPQRAPDARPRAGDGAHRQFVNDVAGAVETDTVLDTDADRRVGGKPDPAHHGEQFFARADAGAAVTEVTGGPLEPRDAP